MPDPEPAAQFGYPTGPGINTSLLDAYDWAPSTVAASGTARGTGQGRAPSPDAIRNTSPRPPPDSPPPLARAAAQPTRTAPPPPAQHRRGGRYTHARRHSVSAGVITA